MFVLNLCYIFQFEHLVSPNVLGRTSPPPAAFCSKADSELCAGARDLEEMQDLKKISLVLRKKVLT